ncbi:MAG: terminase small subunit [Oscillospiraceae bacterium]
MSDSITAQSMAKVLAAEKQANNHKSKMYKELSDAHKANQLAADSCTKRKMLQESTVRTRLDLKDTPSVQARTFEYMEATEIAKVFPSVSGLALAFGCSRQNLNQFLLAHPTHPTTDFIQQVKEAFADIISNAGLYGSANPIMSIFILKNNHGFVDRLDLAPVAQTPTDGDYDVEAIRKRYLLDDTEK